MFSYTPVTYKYTLYKYIFLNSKNQYEISQADTISIFLIQNDIKLKLSHIWIIVLNTQ